MNKHKKEEPIVFYLPDLWKYIFGCIMTVIGLPSSLLCFYQLIQSPSWKTGDIFVIIIAIFVTSFTTALLVTGLYYFFKPIPQVKIEGNKIYYSDMCRHQTRGGNISLFFPYTCSIEDHQFSLDSVDSFNSTSLIFSFKDLASQQNSVSDLQIKPMVSRKDHIRIREIISERIKQN